MSNRFWSNVASVLSGTAVAQAVPILGSLALARFYLPSAFGSYSVWVGVVLILAVMATLRLEMALVVVEDGQPRRDAAQLVFVTVVLVALLGGAVLALLWTFGLMLADLRSPFLLGSAILAAAMTALSDSWQTWAAADGHYRALIRIRVVQVIAIVGAQLGAVLVATTPEMLVVGHLLGLLGAICVAAWQLPMTFPPLRGLAHRLYAFWTSHSRFPLFALPADSINSISAQLPLMVVATRFGSESAGFLALTMRVLGAPLALLGRSVLDVFRRHAADAFRRKGDCRSEYLSTFRILLAGSLVFVVGTIFLAQPIFEIGFGSKWAMAGVMAMWLAPLFALRFVASPLSYVFYIVGRQNVDLVWQIGLISVVIGALWLPATLQETLLAYTYGYSAMYVIYLGISYHYSKGRHA
jgi:O-antigen/teichoic acid export membrane protein